MRITKTLFISAVLLMSATGLQAAGFIQKGNYLTVQLKEHQNYGPSQIRLQVVNDQIIRVQATAEQSFRNKQSLIIVPQNSKSNYKVEEQGDKLIITTDKNRKAKFYRALGDARFEIMLKNKLYKGRGDELSYDVANEIYEIKGNAVVEEAQSNQKLVGETIIIDKKQESYTVMSVEQKPVKFTFELDKK